MALAAGAPTDASGLQRIRDRLADKMESVADDVAWQSAWTLCEGVLPKGTDPPSAKRRKRASGGLRPPASGCVGLPASGGIPSAPSGPAASLGPAASFESEAASGAVGGTPQGDGNHSSFMAYLRSLDSSELAKNHTVVLYIFCSGGGLASGTPASETAAEKSARVPAQRVAALAT